MMPDHEDHHDPEPTRRESRTLYRVGSALGVLAGVLFLVAFGAKLFWGDGFSWFYLVAGVVFLLFPLLLRGDFPRR